MLSDALATWNAEAVISDSLKSGLVWFSLKHLYANKHSRSYEIFSQEAGGIVCYLLLHNELYGNLAAWNIIHLFSHSFQESEVWTQFNRVLFSGPCKATGCWPGVFLPGVWIPLPGSCGGWQNFVPVVVGLRCPFSCWLSSGSQLLEAANIFNAICPSDRPPHNVEVNFFKSRKRISAYSLLCKETWCLWPHHFCHII